MRLSKKYGGIQFFAPAKPHSCTMYFDSHISKVYSPAGTYASYNYTEAEWTQSGQSVTSNYDYLRTYFVTLDAGYQIDTVTISGETPTSYAPVISEDGTSFSGEFSYGGPINITITSKYVGGTAMSKSVDLTTLSGYEALPAGTYQLGVKAKAAGYTDSDLSSTVSFTKLAAPVVTAADATVSWDAVTNAESYDMYVDGELYENTTGGYDITVNVTNGTYTGDTSISNTATITITADSGYNLPDTVTVTGASQNWNKETGTLTLSNPTGAVTVTAVCEAAVTYPVKGDLITIENKLYRVLKVNGSVAEVLAMYRTDSQKFNSSGNSNVYANSSLDVYLSQTFYNSLSTAMQNAIVAKTFQQDSWYYGSNSSAIAKYNGTYQTTNNYTLSLMSTTFGTSISRKCYVLSCQDVIDYLEVTTSMGSADTTLTSENVWRMFWNQTTSISEYPWLRSASFDSSGYAFDVTRDYGRLSSLEVDFRSAVRPAFQIDLSKIEWTKQTGETYVLNDTISAPSNTIDKNINFLCVGTSQNFIRILIESEGKGVHLEYFAQGDSSTSGTSVSTGGTAVSTEYRTLTFATAPTGDLLAWLQANATKQ